jgi:hypothetical protein
MQWINNWLMRKGKQKMKENNSLQADTNVRIVYMWQHENQFDIN